MPAVNGVGATQGASGHPDRALDFQAAVYAIVRLDEQIEDLESKQTEINAMLTLLRNQRVSLCADINRIHAMAGKPNRSMPVLDRHMVVENGIISTRRVISPVALHVAAMQKLEPLVRVPVVVGGTMDGYGDFGHHVAVGGERGETVGPARLHAEWLARSDCGEPMDPVEAED